MSKKLWRLGGLAAVGAVLVAGAVGYREFFLIRPVGEGPAGPAVDPAVFGEVWGQRKVLLLGVGDSVTAGYGVPAALGYVARLADIYDPSDAVGDPPTAGLPDWPDCMAICRKYNEAIGRVAAGRKNVHLVPIREAFLGHGVHCRQPWREHYRADDPHYWYGGNLEDPNERGYDAIRRLFLIEMAQVLPEALWAPQPTAPPSG